MFGEVLHKVQICTIHRIFFLEQSLISIRSLNSNVYINFNAVAISNRCIFTPKLQCKKTEIAQKKLVSFRALRIGLRAVRALKYSVRSSVFRSQDRGSPITRKGAKRQKYKKGYKLHGNWQLPNNIRKREGKQL